MNVKNGFRTEEDLVKHMLLQKGLEKKQPLFKAEIKDGAEEHRKQQETAFDA